MTKIINLFAGPGAGKSTLAAGVFSKLKLKGISCELVTEYAKDATWSGDINILNNQLYILAKQHNRQFKLLNKVDYVINDSPLILSLVYGQSNTKIFNNFIFELFNSFNNINYFVLRTKPYIKVGRNQSESEAKDIDRKLLDKLGDLNIPFSMIYGDRSGINSIVSDWSKK